MHYVFYLSFSHSPLWVQTCDQSRAIKRSTRKKSVTTIDGRRPPFMGAQFSFWSFFSRFGHMSDFFVSQKDFSRQNSMLLAWLEVISHYQLSSPVHW